MAGPREHAGRPQRRGQGCAADQRRRRLRALPACHPLRLDRQPAPRSRPPGALGRPTSTAPTSGRSRRPVRPPATRMLMSNSHLQWGDIHTYFEVQLTAPGVTSYGAVWVGFPVLRQCFTEYLGWTQTTNNPSESDLYRPGPEGRRLRARRPGRAVRHAHRDDQGATGRRRAARRADGHPPQRARPGRGRAQRRDADRDAGGRHRSAAAVRAVLAHGPGHNLDEWQAAMRMQQLPLFNTAYADRDGHIAYVYNATLPVAPDRRLPLLARRRAGRPLRSHPSTDRALRRDSRR